MSFRIRTPQDNGAGVGQINSSNQTPIVTPELIEREARIASLARGEITALADLEKQWQIEKTLISGTLNAISQAAVDKTDYRSEDAILKGHATTISELYKIAIGLKRKDPVYCGIKSSTLWRYVAGYGGWVAGVSGVGTMGYNFIQGEKQDVWSFALTISGFVLTAGREWLFNRAEKEMKDQQSIHNIMEELRSALMIVKAQEKNLMSIVSLIQLSQRPEIDAKRVKQKIRHLKGEIHQAATRAAVQRPVEASIPISVTPALGVRRIARMSTTMVPSLVHSELVPSFDEQDFRREPHVPIAERLAMSGRIERPGMPFAHLRLQHKGEPRRRHSFNGSMSGLSTVVEPPLSQASSTDTPQIRSKTTSGNSGHSTEAESSPAAHVAISVATCAARSSSSSVVSLGEDP